MYGNSLRENREIPGASLRGVRDRPVKGVSLYDRRVRDREVGWVHSTEEADEQS